MRAYETRNSKKLTGPISVKDVSSRTFSMADFEGSMGGGLIRVAEGIVQRLKAQFFNGI